MSTDVFRRADGVISEVVDGRAVLIDPQGAELFGLNPVGTVVWDLLDGSKDVATLAAGVAELFEGADVADVERDVAAFLGDLLERGLALRG